ncbi:MAG TPA: flagellin lysine-N-methylase, partial [Bacillota bacterium]|nr:flagellin lysine-N-methylase [Bacillota bacterium]
EIAHNYQGNCPMLMENGYCELHANCGEDSLPSVCRYYPRGPRNNYAFESSCANSCEKTLELLFDHTQPLTFEKKNLSFKMVLSSKPITEVEKESYQNVRQICFDLLQDRKKILSERIIEVGHYLYSLEKDGKYSDGQPGEPIDALQIFLDILTRFSEIHPAFSEALNTIEALVSHSSIESVYASQKKHFEKVLPYHEIWFEKAFINHLFFRQFPYQDPNRTFKDEYIAFAGKYMFVKTLSIFLMADKHTKEDFIDILTMIFRVVAHTQFEKNILILLRKNHIVSFSQVSKLLK